MEKKEALQIMYQSALLYKKNLENHNVLFVYGLPKHPQFFETVFLERNFYHLTGVELEVSILSSHFYRLLLDGKLTVNDFSFPKDGTAENKLIILPSLMNIHSAAKMVGVYADNRPLLMTDRLIGNVNACIGFIQKNDCSNYYVPNTALKADIRNLVTNTQRVLAVFKKKTTDKKYAEPCYVAKKLTIEDIDFTSELKIKLGQNPDPPVIKRRLGLHL